MRPKIRRFISNRVESFETKMQSLTGKPRPILQQNQKPVLDQKMCTFLGLDPYAILLSRNMTEETVK